MRPLLLLLPLVLLATGCGAGRVQDGSSDPVAEEVHEPTLEETYEAIDAFAEAFFAEVNPDAGFRRGTQGELYGCGGLEGVDKTRLRYHYIFATTTDDPARALTRAQELLAEIDIVASPVRQGQGYRFVTFDGPHFGGGVRASSDGGVALNGETICVANPDV